MNVRVLAAAALAIAVSVLPLRAQTPYLVADLNTTPTVLPRSSSPSGFQAFGDTLFFSATDAQGVELWKYSGGIASRVADIAPGSAGSSPGALADIGGGVYLFPAQDSHGYELWRTDGTAAGTSLVKDIHPTNHGVTNWSRQVFNGRVFFAANDGVHGVEPWVSDGTEAGTQMLRDLDDASTSSSPTLFTPLGSKMLIFGANGLWSSDGTTLGTTLLATVGVASAQGRVGNTLYFTATGNGTTGRELWKTDGTAAGTQPVADVVPGPADGFSSTSTFLMPLGSTIYFNANRPGGGIELWKSDGTAAGTQFVKTLTTDMYASVRAMFVASDLLTFQVENSLWRSDGTAAGTYSLDAGTVYRVVPAFGRAYFFRSGAADTELWSTDGVTTQFITTMNAGLPLTFTGGKLYFTAYDALYGQEPWVCETGTAATTHRLANVYPDVAPSASPTALTAAGDLLFFRADDGFTRQEIWRSNGTQASTFRLTSPVGSLTSTLSLLTGWNGALYFQQGSKKLWRSAGTVDDTAVVKDMTGMPLQRTFPGGGYLFFSTGSLWRTDGTETGTIPLGDLLPIYMDPSDVTGFAELTGRVFVTGYQSGAWSTDGSPASTKYLFGKNPLMTEVSPAAAAGAFFFVATTAANGRELWRSDGTGGSELLVKDIAAGTASSSPVQLTPAGRYLYFVADDAVHGVELWRTDGTAAGTILLNDIAAGGTSSTPANLTAAGEWLYFTANDGSHGLELWRTDGTAPGTVIVSDLRAGSASADPGSLKFADGTLWFAADDGVAGRELWRLTGGVPSMVADLGPGSRSSSPTELVQVGQLFYFAAETDFGRELWAMPLTTSPSLRVDDARITEGTGGTRTVRFTVTRTGDASGAPSAAFTTVNGSATAGADYVAQSGTVAFTAGQTSRFIDVVVQSDAVIEENEGFFVTLSAPSGATLSRAVGTGVIDDDDHRAELSIVPVIDAGSPYERVFRITNAGPSAANDLRVRYSESPGEISLEMNDRCITAAENPLTCSFETLAAGASIDVTVQRGNPSARQFDEDDPRPGLTVTATVTATELDTNPADNTTARMISLENRIFAPPYLTSGTAATAQIFFYNAYPNAVTVALTSSVASVVVTPSSVSIPPGQRLAQFTITAGNYTGPVTLTMPALTNFYYASSMTLYVVAPGQLPKMASSMVVGDTWGVYGTPIVTPVTIAARRHDGTTPTGLVSLLNDAGDVVVAQHPLDAAGKTTFEFAGLQPGSRYYRLRYHGDANFLPLQDARFEVTVQPWPTTVSLEDPALICSGVASELYVDVKTTQTTTSPTGSVQVTIEGIVEMLPLSPTGPGASRAIIRRPFQAGSNYVSAYYIPTGTFAGEFTGAHILAQPCIVMNVQATGISSSSVAVNWSPVAGATHYEVVRTSNTDNWQAVGTTTSTSLVDGGYPWTVAHLYTVRAFNAAGQDMGWGVPDLGMSMLFADDPVIPGVTRIRGVHNQQVRGSIEGMRYLGHRFGDVTNVPPTPPGTIVSAADIMALRAEIATLRRGLGLPQFVFTDPALTVGSLIKAIHMQELREAVK